MTAQVRQRGVSTPARASGAWPLERILFGMAGTVTLASALLAAVLSPWWLLVAAFVGVNQLAFVTFGDCVASLLLRKLFGVERGCVR
jgi:Zn-dependent protease